MTEKSRKADGAGMLSRRDAIVGALALTAGSLIASKPDVALAATGGTMYIGTDMVSTSITSITRRTAGADDISYAFLNHNLGDQHIGVYGSPTDQAGAESVGVYGLASSASHYGVRAEHYDMEGVALLATNPSGTALVVDGKAKFFRSGIGLVSKGRASKTVTVPSGLNTRSRFIVTLMSDGGSGVYLKYAGLRNATQFKVVLTKKSTKATKFSWMVTD